MKTLEESDDEYNTLLEELLEKFQEGMKKGKDHEDLHQEFQKKFQKILNKRNKSQETYMKYNKEKILGLSKKKEKKPEKKKIFNPKAFDFTPTFFEKILKFLKFIWFKIKLKKTVFWNNKIIVYFRVFFLRRKIFFASIFTDVKIFTDYKAKGAKAFVLKYFEKTKVKVTALYTKLKTFSKESWEKVVVMTKKIKTISDKIRGKKSEEAPAEKAPEEKKDTQKT